MADFQVHILAADHTLYEGPCQSLVVPALRGQYGILAHHSNTVCGIVPGRLTYRTPDGTEQVLAVSSGLVKMEDNDVLVLVDSAERPEEIDANWAQREADEAREILLQKRSMQEYRAARAKLARGINRLRRKTNAKLES